MSKRTVRLTESDLHDMIKESVERILNEGKIVNNKPFFKDGWTGEFVEPGYNARRYPRDDYWQKKGFEDAMDAYNAAKNANDDRLTMDEFNKGQKEFDELVRKHEKRTRENYYMTNDENDITRLHTKPIYTRDADIARFEIHNKNKIHQRKKNNDKRYRSVYDNMSIPPFNHTSYYDLYNDNDDM